MLSKQELSIVRNNLLNAHDTLGDLFNDVETLKELDIINKMMWALVSLLDKDEELEKAAWEE